MDTIGKRLRWAIERHPEASIRRFQQSLARAGIDGSSPPAINRYLKDVTAPSVDWIVAAAELLQVRWEWLAVGSGLPTAVEQAAQQIARGERANLESVLAEGVPGLANASPGTYGAVVDAVFSWAWEMGDERFAEADAIQAIVRRVWDLINSIPNQVLSVDVSPLQYLTPDEAADYVRAVCNAIILSRPRAHHRKRPTQRKSSGRKPRKKKGKKG